MKFSANLGFLWTDRTLPDAIRAAKTHGFDAVECHWPYDIPPSDVVQALAETQLPLLSLNTVRGAAGENGLSALPDRQPEARAAIDQAIAYAKNTNARAVHVMAGIAKGPEAHVCFVENLTYATQQAASLGKIILIEPLNRYDAPGYFLRTTTQVIEIIEEVAAPNLRLMFDCYHVQLTEGDVSNRLRRLMPHIGHIQFANAPGRTGPEDGELNFHHLFRHIRSLGYSEPLGAEYRPEGATEDTLGWLKTFQDL